MAKKKKVLVTLLVIVLAVAVVVLDAKRRDTEQKLRMLSVRLEQVQQQKGTEKDDQAAQRILQRVRRHVRIADDVNPTVATIVDVEALKASNAFYAAAENGDHLIVTPTRAILYDPDADIILDVVPVQIQPRRAPGAEATEGGTEGTEE
jgi:predicted Holliday junction resolvase-like endonuclease